jgi:hypothetical protein
MDDDEILLEETIRDIMIDLCEVLYNHGYKEVPIGPIMRLIGVEDSQAVDHDKEMFELGDDFKKLLELHKDSPKNNIVPPGTTVH